MNPLAKVNQLGQSIWLDFFDREMMNSGMLQRMLDEDKITGITSNPSIFENALYSGTDYDEDVKTLSADYSDPEELFFKFAVKDIRRATDIMRPIYDATQGNDGFVSLEVSPFLANDEEGTVRQAMQLWEEVDRENVMIKIPSTVEGLRAIRRVTAEGVNVNVTLLFGLERYREVVEAYIAGLEDRLAAGKPIDKVRSVASFFLSRIDVLLDPQLKEKGLDHLVGEIAVANARTSYQIYKELFGSERFKKLQASGGVAQRLLWASTGTKDPAYSDVKYVDTLIGENTVNTIPIDTLNAFRDHGTPAITIEEDIEKAAAQLKELKDNGFDMEAISQHLEEDGVEKFNVSFRNLLKAVEEKMKSV